MLDVKNRGKHITHISLFEQSRLDPQERLTEGLSTQHRRYKAAVARQDVPDAECCVSTTTRPCFVSLALRRFVAAFDDRCMSIRLSTAV